MAGMETIVETTLTIVGKKITEVPETVHVKESVLAVLTGNVIGSFKQCNFT
ncbi:MULTISPECIES: hypothetical protein [Oceanobacillus]|uniref:hypothetical protein n=1 Tax=Oceanobacillus TaxID=182709 RepID=UPI000AF8FA34|nr:hypothetical protein [Oceanobacillus sojae]